MRVLKSLKRVGQIDLFKKWKLKILLKKQFIIFIFVGGINTIFGYSIFAFLIFLKIRYYLSFLIATSLGLIFNFMTTGRIVFKNKNFSLFYRFIFINIVMCILNIILIRIINIHINNFYISGLMSMAITVLVAFYLNKKVFTMENTANNMEKCLKKQVDSN